MKVSIIRIWFWSKNTKITSFTISLFFFIEEDMRVNILASNNFFERRIDTESIYRNAVQFQILGKYMFVTKYAGNDKKHLDLFVSMTGEKFVQAR